MPHCVLQAAEGCNYALQILPFRTQSTCLISFQCALQEAIRQEREGDDNDLEEDRDIAAGRVRYEASQPARALVSRKDLEEHFGYSLAEAAAQLGVCKTTIKRACR